MKSYKNGIAGVSSQYQEMVDWIHKMETASTSGMTINQIEQQRAAINRIKNDLEVFDGELKEVGLNPNNLKTDSLDKLKNEIRKTSSQILKTKSAMSQTTAQINKTNADIATESTRFSNLKSSISRNAPALKSMSKQLKQTGDVSAAGKLKKGFSGLKGIFGNIGSAAGAAFGKVHSHLKNMRASSGTASKSLLNVVKSIRRIGVVSLGLKVCKNIFGELRSVITGYLSQNEALNNRVEALKMLLQMLWHRPSM